ncbi:MAG: hypothetical protein DRR19_29345 [Candidatus Parabeggiatoa sp. nov. 1]|nr:MAG: hypothetical protein DRR19_29345 [Gammaproteobacteria bacterium]
MTAETYNIDPTTERFAVALFVATLVHIVVIHGIGFVAPKPAETLNTSMEIILVQKSTDKAPEKADYLAQVNHEGGGDSEQEGRPSTPTLAPFPDQTANTVFTPPPPQVAAARLDKQIETLTIDKPAQHEVEQQITPPDGPTEQGNGSQDIVSKEYMSDNILYINVLTAKRASIQAELYKTIEAHAKKPRSTFIHSSTREYKYANYMDAWRRKAEGIGNTNYPDKVRRKKLSGSLILDVALNSNGTIHNVEIKESSKYQIIDEAALRIVRLAAPFDAFPESIRKGTDILHITSTWEFRYNRLTVDK